MPPATKRGPGRPKGSGSKGGNAGTSRKRKDTTEVRTQQSFCRFRSGCLHGLVGMHRGVGFSLEFAQKVSYEYVQNRSWFEFSIFSCLLALRTNITQTQTSTADLYKAAAVVPQISTPACRIFFDVRPSSCPWVCLAVCLCACACSCACRKGDFLQSGCASHHGIYLVAVRQLGGADAFVGSACK